MNHVRYNVEPRYTCGSPAQVDKDTAERVGRSEARAYQDHLDGVHGEENRERAVKEGLGLIAFTMKETRKGWEVVDLITDEEHFWPFVAKCPTCGEKVELVRGRLKDHWVKGSSFHCSNNSYMGTTTSGKLTVTTTSGERFSEHEHRQLAQLVYKRFGNDAEAATAAWRRMLQNSCEVSQFLALVGE